MNLKGWKAMGFKTYEEYLNSYLWQEKRLWIIQVKGGFCERCGSDKNIEVHHKNYSSVGNENSEDVEVLCFKCHRGEHEK